ncbi:Sporulation domain protein [Ferrimonas balearica DSM 9799]|uniref:Sporulation domain protein n=1 Tax=Ferrimonas balearica (strain DSM 9799 / CCM 4581 / KCTC 23876 / PAT) TaxID=550540 RepID=E1SN62_FERBD|nr:SPOR domain-containing protein [Ferrimonas balearica]MBY6019179.1 SPOR domain-containing protein [Halomonas denitrificans]ADN77720.1 Sporulation domain protein [Ferrimonas balearica DSM 9799]MBW3140913.1 SPOR domain-containing protein [Ferrimonas balearica]MBW3165884.1 SPOR domain-containing protein [Ferrimonas balearica]MBY5981794.1 SPOR domain-containing protein [Ferrimonas balearica]
MAKDYAGRGRPARKPARGRSKAPAKKPFPWPMALVVVALLCFFGYLLLTIQGASDREEGTTPDAAVEQPAPKPKKEQAPLPEKPQEDWQYIDVLPNSEVEVEVPEQETGGPYQMQCGSFRSEDQANAMRATIAFQGLESQVRRSEGRNGVWFRVVLGPYERKRLAEKDRHTLQRSGINTCQIWLWN